MKKTNNNFPIESQSDDRGGGGEREDVDGEAVLRDRVGSSGRPEPKHARRRRRLRLGGHEPALRPLLGGICRPGREVDGGGAHLRPHRVPHLHLERHRHRSLQGDEVIPHHH